MRHSHSTHYSSAGHSVNPAHSAHTAHSSSSDRSQYATHNGVPGGDYTQHQHPTTPYYGKTTRRIIIYNNYLFTFVYVKMVGTVN